MVLKEMDSLAIPSVSQDPSIGKSEEVRRRCLSAKKLEAVGDYEGARGELGDQWQRVGERPDLGGLDEGAQAELLLRAGILSGWLGHAHQIDGAQAMAKDLISESERIFEGLGLTERVADAQIDLALCYWREGGFDEARVILRDVSHRLRDGKSEPRLRALANMAVLERTATRYKDALRIQMEAAPLFDECKNHSLRGNFHNEFALVLKNLGLAEGRQDYIDRAFIEYAASSYHYERAGHTRALAIIENNLGNLFLSCGKLLEAHQHLNRARALFVKHKDKGSIAQVDETRARAFLAEGRSSQAEMAVRGSVRILEEGDEQTLLAEALTTHGTALARLGRYPRATVEFNRAIELAEQAGAPELAGLAALLMIEELSRILPLAAMREIYHTAEALVHQSQDPGIGNRLGQCARGILAAEHSKETASRVAEQQHGDQRTAHHQVSPNGNSTEAWNGCALEAEVLSYEGQLIKRALEASNGSVTRAARMLGITHQGLAFILNGRHRNLLNVRTPVKHRRRSILKTR